MEKFKKGDKLVISSSPNNSVEITYSHFAGYDANGKPCFMDTDGEIHHYYGWKKKWVKQKND